MSWAIAASAPGAGWSEVALLAQSWLKAEPRWLAGEDARTGALDEDLIARARRDEPGAIQQIYERHAAAVYRRLTHLVGPDPEREDLMQEAFADLFRQLASYRGAASLRTYLFRIVSNKAFDHLRQRQRRQRVVVDSSGLSTMGGDDASTPPASAPSRVLKNPVQGIDSPAPV